MSNSYLDSIYNCYREKINSISGNKIAHIATELKKEDNFYNFAISSNKSANLAMYSFVIAGELAENGLKITQLRKFYHYVKKMQYEVDGDLTKVLAKLKFLLPKLAGASTKKQEIKPLYKIISACIEKDNIKTSHDVLFFIEFFEAIINYFETLSNEKRAARNTLMEE